METPLPLQESEPDLVLLRLAATIREAIVSGRLKPGQRLVESEFARDYQVGRDVLRDVFQVLAYEGLVSLPHHRGAYVSPLSDHDLRELFAVRIALECAAAKLAARHAAPDALAQAADCLTRQRAHLGQADTDVAALVTGFHDAVIRASGNHLLAGLYDQIRPRFSRYQSAIAELRDPPPHALDEQDAILNAIIRHAPRVAAQLMEDHLSDMLAALPPVTRALRPRHGAIASL